MRDLDLEAPWMGLHREDFYEEEDDGYIFDEDADYEFQRDMEEDW